jgi:murein DD-endopeptidase MepM/ murein hydrolase activator NlpD
MPSNLRRRVVSDPRSLRWPALAGTTVALAALAYLAATGGLTRFSPRTTPAQPPHVAATTPSLPALALRAVTPPPLAQRTVQSAAFGASAIDVIVKSNDTLDAIFRRLKLDLADLASLRSLPGLKARLDSLRPGELLHLVHRDGSLVGLERRLNDTQTLQVTRENDQLHANVLEQPLEARERTIRAVIDSSLFEAVENAGAHDQTALTLADIFRWDIDFVLEIQPGDSFVVTYQELYRNGAYLKDGPVLAASFINHGREYVAVRYVDPNGGVHYYTPDGKSMHKAFLRAPLEFSRVSSRFNTARRHPILNLIRAHKGVDYAAPIGTPVSAAGDGRVRFAGVKGGYGNVVEIDHSHGIVTVYGHLSRFAKETHVGAHVTQGSIIAYVGMTGLATGPHLHYEYRVDGVFKNPQTVILPDAEPIDARWHDDFVARTTPLLGSLVAPLGPVLVAR